ncbi:MAG: c-type cytochrome biogenesis protein CcmI [Pseudomonadota bacterium]
MIFWIVISALATAIVAGTLARALLGGRRSDATATAFDVRVYRDQLDELERDVARGLVDDADAERTRIEISRRLLEADRLARARGPESTGGPAGLTVLGVALLLAGSGGLYWIIGVPGYQDLPLERRLEMADEARANRDSQAQAETSRPETPFTPIDPDYARLTERLRAALEQRPDDAHGFDLLARSERLLGDFRAAHGAKARAIALKSDEERRAEDYVEYAELLILAVGGYVSPEAEAALQEALRRDPRNGVARYYMGLMFDQNGRPDLAFRIWRRLQDQSAPDAPWLPAVRSRIEAVARKAGLRYQPPSPPRTSSGPDAADIAAAESMSPEERETMIEGMVARLGERLATEGGSPEEWAQMIRSLGVLGDTGRADTILKEARRVFARDEDALRLITRAAREAGVIN